MRQVSFDDKQLGIILKSAQHIPSQWRNRFLENVIDCLFASDTVTDDAVREAVRSVSLRMCVNINGNGDGDDCA
jgi:hypothetical protein